MGSVRPPKTPLMPRKKIVGAGTDQGITAPGTRSSSFPARAIRALTTATLARQAGIAIEDSISRPSACAAGRWR